MQVKIIYLLVIFFFRFLERFMLYNASQELAEQSLFYCNDKMEESPGSDGQGCQITSGRCKPTESAAENIPPDFF